MPEFDDLGSLDDLGDLDGISFDDAPAGKSPAAPAPAAAVSGLGAVIQDLLARRNYQQVLQIAASQQDAVARDPQVAGMVQHARAQLEQEAFLHNFLDAARKAFAAGNLEQARQFVEKARALDASHPDVGGMLAHLARVAATRPPAPVAPPVQPAAPVAPAAAFAPPAQPAFAPAPPARPVAPVAPPASDLLSFDDPPLAQAPAPSFAIDALSFDEPAVPVARPAPQVFDPSPPGPAETSFGDLTFDAPSPGTGASFPQADFGASAFTPASPAAGASFGGTDFGFGAAPTPGTESSFAPPPAMPSPAGAGGGFGGGGFGGGGFGGGASEGGDRIQELLAEGQQHFDRQEFQLAIDVWSRIFLIDIENQEASRRIEAARQQRAERDRRADELFAQASAAIEAQSLDDAKNLLGQALAFNPGHAHAREFLDQLNAGKVPLVRRPDEASIDLLDDGGFGDLQKAAGMRTTGQTLEAAVARDRIVVVKKTDKKLMAAAALGALVLLGGLGYVVTNWSKLFPAEKEQAVDPGARPTGTLDRARKVFDSGKIENAIALAEKINANDPDYKEAQALLVQWKAMVKTGAGEETGPAPEQVARRKALIDAGRDAHRQKQYLRARKFFERAAKIQPLEAADQALRGESDVALQALEKEIARFNAGDYEELLPTLWRLHDTQPGNIDITMMMIDSYYNLAVGDLQRGYPEQARDKLKEAAALTSGNDELDRLRSFAESYAGKGQDLRYRIFVKYLPLRG